MVKKCTQQRFAGVEARLPRAEFLLAKQRQVRMSTDPFESYPDGHRGLGSERAVRSRATGMTTVQDACDGVSGRV
jgi:hypothetical protein